MTDRISFLCSKCGARLCASLRFAGRLCPCPQCSTQVLVPVRSPGEEPPVLVLDDGHRLPRTQMAWE